MDIKKSYELSTQLDADTLEKARKELNEKDSKQVTNDIEATKEWISKQTYMKSKTDNEFILAFLRAAKYSYSRTQELIYNYWVNRTTMTDVFQNRNYDDDSILMEIADQGIYVKLPHVDKEGRVVIIQRMGLWDVQKYDFSDIAKYMFTCLDVVSLDPRAQINGIVVLLDMTGISSAHASHITPARAQKFTKCLQDMYPIRIKGMNYYNYPKLFDAIFSIVKVFLKEKLKKRIKFHGSDLKSVQKEIPKSILPKEYGGELDSITKINEQWVNYLKTKTNLLLDFQNYGVDVNKLPKPIDNNASATDSVASSTGLTGTFRKLNVD